LEVREGERRNPAEKVVTERRLAELGLTRSNGRSVAAAPVITGTGGIVMRGPNGSLTTLSADEFAAQILQTTLFKRLNVRIDDPTRFDDLPAQVKSQLLAPLAAIDNKIDASIRRLDAKFASANESLASTLTETRASVLGAAAGVRQMTYAYAGQQRATAGAVTTITARLDDFDGGGATVEETMTAVADRATGLEAQYTIKVATNHAMAGIGLAATTSASGNSTSSVIIQADKFAVVSSSDTLSGAGTTASPYTPPANRVPFGIDTTNNTVYINGAVRINSGGTRLDSVTKGIALVPSATSFSLDSSGAPSPSSITLTATNVNGTSGTITWSASSGATLTGSGTGSPSTRTLTYANLTVDSCTVTASVTDAATGVTYSATVFLSKNGIRGPMIGYGQAYGIKNASWDDQYANRVISNILSNAVATSALASTALNRIGDQVTLGNTSPWLETKGDYNGGTTYFAGQLALNTGHTAVYRALQTTTGNAVTNTTYWAKFVDIATYHASWASSSNYPMNDVVVGSNSVGTSTAWLCLFQHTSGSAFAGDRDGGGYSETRYWGGSAWLRTGVIIEGPLYVTNDITGGANIDIYGRARFEGNFAVGGYDSAIVANNTRGAPNGIVAWAGADSGVSVVNISASAPAFIANMGGGSDGYYGVGIGTGWMFHAEGVSGGKGAFFNTDSPSSVALKVGVGQLQIDTGKFSTGSAGTASFGGTKPGASATNHWIEVYKSDGTKGWTPWWPD
jgi:hypothetical protein